MSSAQKDTNGAGQETTPPGRPESAVELRVSVVDGIRQVSRADWDACANPNAKASTQPKSERNAAPCLPGQDSNHDIAYNPFISHDFLSALEDSKSVGGRSGWHVRHVLVQTTDGTLLAAAPCYVKSHSRGEYVFDRGWAEAYERAGGSYYPKLQVAVPFTPATGRRFLVKPGPEAPAARQALARGLLELCRHDSASGVHVTFAVEPEFRFLGELGFLQRNDQQFHWQNASYGSFDDFLGALASRKRKTLRRERQDALSNGITVHWLTGSDLTEE